MDCQIAAAFRFHSSSSVRSLDEASRRPSDHYRVGEREIHRHFSITLFENYHLEHERLASLKTDLYSCPDTYCECCCRR